MLPSLVANQTPYPACFDTLTYIRVSRFMYLCCEIQISTQAFLVGPPNVTREDSCLVSVSVRMAPLEIYRYVRTGTWDSTPKYL